MILSGAAFPDILYYDTMIMYLNHSSGDFLSHYYQDGTWEYSIGDVHRPVFAGKAAELERDDIAEVLEDWGVTVPTEAEFTLEKAGDTVVSATFTTDLTQVGDNQVHGTVVCRLQEVDGKTYITDLENSMVTLVPRSEKRILTPTQAIQKLQEGHSFYGKLLEHYASACVEVGSCKLDWLVDTKGFYQPVYRIELSLPDEGEITDFVPAL